MRSPLADMVRMCMTSERDNLGTWCSAPLSPALLSPALLSPALLHSAEFSSVNTCDRGREKEEGEGKGERGEEE